MSEADRSWPKFAPFALYGVFSILIGAAIFLPTLLPSAIGTGYIAIYFVMSAMSIFVWRSKIITPRAALVLALIACLCLGFIVPYTSNDAERYLWDGAVFLSGLDPYMVAPNDPRAAELRVIWPTPEEHANYPTLYPPGGLTLFALCALAGPTYGIWVWKFLTSLALILTLIISYKLLHLRKLAHHFYLIALSPLLLFETQIGAHLDIFSVLGIVAALWCLEKEKILWAAIIIGLSATTKFLPAILIGPYLFYLHPKRALTLFLGAAGTWLSLYGIMFSLGYKPLGLLPTFFEKWRGGAPLFPILEAVQNTLNLSSRSFMIGLGFMAILGFSLSAWLARNRNINIALSLAISVPLLLSPVLFPWYLLTLVPLLALRPSYTVLAAVTLAPLSYIVLNRWLYEGVWAQAAWPAQVLLVGIIAGLCLDIARPLANRPAVPAQR